jgi:hypothetical protein
VVSHFSRNFLLLYSHTITGTKERQITFLLSYCVILFFVVDQLIKTKFFMRITIFFVLIFFLIICLNFAKEIEYHEKLRNLEKKSIRGAEDR